MVTMTRLAWWDSVWIMALAAYMLAGTALTPFHGDEATQIFMSRDYAYQFIQRDLSQVRYSDPPISPQEQELRLLNGTINKYLIGLAWHLAGFTSEDINEQWDWGADWDYNIQTGHAPSAGLLRVARWPSSLFMAAGSAVMFALGWSLRDRLTAYLVSLYYALNPALLLNGHRAMMEGSFIFFSLLTVLAGLLWLRRGGWWFALLFGISSGLALASKHSAAFTVAAVFAGCFLPIVWRGSRPPLRRMGMLLSAGLVALLVFYALNPAWWGDPVERASTVLALRENLLAIQVDVFGGYGTLADRLGGFARQALVTLPQYYEVGGWEQNIGDQIAAYEASIWRGVSIGGSWWGAMLLLAIMGWGEWQLVRNPAIERGARWLVSLWGLAMLLLTLGLTPVDWQRYYLPVYPVIGLLAALGLTAMMKQLQDRVAIS